MSFIEFQYQNNFKVLFLPITWEHDEFKIIHGGTKLAHFYPNYKKYQLPYGEIYKIMGKLSEIGDIRSQLIVNFEPEDVEMFTTPKNKLIHFLYYNNIRTKVILELYKPQINNWAVSQQEIDMFYEDFEKYVNELKEAPDDFLILIPI